ncbi:MAG: hypothetical protein ACXIVO_13785 [Glycocaulis sp.]
MSFMTELRKANTARSGLWHPQGVNFRTLEGWFGAVAGETGEMLEAFGEEQGHRWFADGQISLQGVPLLSRRRWKSDSRRRMTDARGPLLDELADVAIYLDLFAACAGHEVRDPGSRYAHELGPDVAFPRAAAFVLKIGDTLHKLERVRADDQRIFLSESTLRETLGDQINHAFVALDSAARSVGSCAAKAIARKFNETSRKKRLPVYLQYEWRVYRAVIGGGDQA